MDIFDGLNEQQKEAALATEGPVLILAGAGSGKTRTLTHRIAYLIEEKKVSPENILAVTFTNKAANNMKERIEKLLESSGKNFKTNLFWLGTFHSICVKILRREAEHLDYSSRFTIFDEDDAIRAVKRAMGDLKLDPKKYNPKAVRSYISQAKGELISAKEYGAFAVEHFQEIVLRVYKEYERILRQANAFDFDDLLFKTVQIFQKNPDILAKYQNRFRYILIDEYQDTNHAQYIFLKLLAKKYRNIFAIGDDWQSIYSFRGAKFQNILDFNKDYPDAKIVFLEENYRSTMPILSAAQKVIKNNEMRSDKKLFSKRDEGAPVTVVGSQEKRGEVEFILEEVSSLRAGEGRRFSDFVILYRTNAQSRLFEEQLLNVGIPYRIFGGVRFYERKEIKDIIAYLRLIQNPADQISLTRVINFPPRGIGEKTVEKILADPAGSASTIEKYAKFLSMMEALRLIGKSSTPDELIDQVVRKTSYKEFLSDGTFESQGRLENIEELKVAATTFNSLDDFLSQVALVSDLDRYKESEDVLTLMTIHLAKGLEFPVVFITGMEEGLFPHANSLGDKFQLEEERRLFYVGMTRAMERLYLGFSHSRFMYGRFEMSMPSRFLSELPQDEIEMIDL